ncbi:MAG TPA: SDR family NAD(P)-dependent oxidoreductase [Acidimicrobiia bacterium]
MRIAGTAALVTGGASGLGAATARALSAAGATVTIVDLDGARGAALAEELGGGFARADVADADAMGAAVARAGAAAPLRIAVSCAGIAHAERTLSRDGAPHDLAAFERVVRVNLVGTFNMVRLAATAMARNEGLDDGERGVVVQTASIAASDGQIGQAAYAASKAGVAGLTLPVARDLAAVGVRVVTIAPGTFETPMVAGLPEAARAALAASIPFPRRLGRPDEYAALVRAVCENPMLNGETVRLDGALRMAPR